MQSSTTSTPGRQAKARSGSSTPTIAAGRIRTMRYSSTCCFLLKVPGLSEYPLLGERPHQESLQSWVRQLEEPVRKGEHLDHGATGESHWRFDFNQRVRERGEDKDVFRDFKTPLNNLYGDINVLQSYQMFTMDSSKPGVVHYCEAPENQGDKQNVLTVATSRSNFTVGEVRDYWASALVPLELPKRNSEKIADIYKKVVPFVPAQYRTDPLNIVPTPEDLQHEEEKPHQAQATEHHRQTSKEVYCSLERAGRSGRQAVTQLLFPVELNQT